MAGKLQKATRVRQNATKGHVPTVYEKGTDNKCIRVGVYVGGRMKMVWAVKPGKGSTEGNRIITDTERR